MGILEAQNPFSGDSSAGTDGACGLVLRLLATKRLDEVGTADLWILPDGDNQ